MPLPTRKSKQVGAYEGQSLRTTAKFPAQYCKACKGSPQPPPRLPTYAHGHELLEQQLGGVGHEHLGGAGRLWQAAVGGQQARRNRGRLRLYQMYARPTCTMPVVFLQAVQ